MSAFRAALRISRRDATRSKGRSALIMVMIGLPVLVFTALLTMQNTTDLSPREELPSRLGSVADAAIMTHVSRLPLDQDPAGTYGQQGESKTEAKPWTTEEVARLSGASLLPLHVYSAEVLLPDGFDQVELLETDLRDRLATGIRPLLEGRFPASADELAITPALLDRGIRLGGTLKVTRNATPMRVVGVVEHPNRPGIQEIAGLYGSVLAKKTDGHGTGWLAGTAAPVTMDDVHRLNQAGLRVVSRAVIEGPEGEESDGFRGDQLSWLIIGVILVVTETALLAGPSFAVGLRRRRRELALIAAQGGSPGHLRAIVLADGLLLGGLAALAGAALGIGAGLAVESFVAPMLDWRSGPPDVPWPQVLGVAALGLVSALVAALVPAVQAAGQHPAQILAGRPGEVRARKGMPLAGLALIVLGVAATVMAVFARGDELAVVAAGTVILFGFIASAPWIVRRTGRLAARLPLPSRLSIRDAARHPGRTASAVAAVTAATMAAVALSIGYYSEHVADLDDYRPTLPQGTLRIEASGLDDRRWAALLATARQRMPGTELVTAVEATDAAGRSVQFGTSMKRRDCAECPRERYFLDLPIGDARLLALLQGRRDPEAAAALAAGKAVVFDPRIVENGTISVFAMRPSGEDVRGVPPVRIPAVVATGAEAEQGGAVLPASVAASAGLKTVERRVYAGYSPADHDRFQRDMSAVDSRVNVHSEWYDPTPNLYALLGTALVAALVLVIGGTFAATGLAVADMRADLDTLSAVGGRPLTRRLVAAAQAGYIAGLGALVGLAGGVFTGVALVRPLMTGRGGDGLIHSIAVPWPYLAVVAVGLPVLAAVLAGLFTRTRLVLARRVV